MQPPRTSSLKQVIQRSRNGMYLTKLAAAARRIFRGSGASGPVAPLSFLVSPCGVLWAGVLTVVWCSLVSEPAQGVCEPSVLAKEPLTQRSEYYGNREELRPEVWTHRDLVSRDSVEWKPPRNPVSSSGKWEGPEVWPLLGLAAQLWPSRLSLRRPGHLGACWRLRASGPAWGNPKAAGGRQERPAHHGLQSSVGQKSVLPPTPASDQFITCAVPHLPASPSPLCLARLLSGHLTMQPQFPQGEAFLASLGRSRAVSPSVSWPGFIFLHGTPCHLQFYVSDYLFIISLFLECELRDSGRACLVPLLQAQQFFVL
ncbi:uncharacterized protein LOC129622979 [Bubalus kerabau]|uniref:uncharacterized protein LOC129622979 n=1 Tax=Bubalus carabanensis TaxID=3119969 RepID=UPI00244E652F|nr:uncharacterized protein LOC129622979 [Bubalus carabanensis]